MTSAASGCCTGEEGEEAASVEDEEDSPDESVEVDEDEMQMGSSSWSTEDEDSGLDGTGEVVLCSGSSLSSSSSDVISPTKLSSCSCITLSSIWRTRSFSGLRSSSSLSTRVSPDSLSTTLSMLISFSLITKVLLITGVTGRTLSVWS